MIADGVALAKGVGSEATNAETLRARACYTCKARFNLLHHFYRFDRRLPE